MGLSESKLNETQGMFHHAMNYLNTQGGDEDEIEKSEAEESLPLENRLFSGGKPESTEQILKELKDYRRSKSAKAKEAVMQSLIVALNELGIKTESDDIDDIIKTVEKKIPNPRKGDSFVEDSQTQREACKSIAKAINKGLRKVYGDRVGDLIDPSGPAEYICSSVVDLLHSFTSGIYLEYIDVRDAISKVMQELLQAQEILRQAVNHFAEKVDKEELSLDIGADRFFEIYKQAEKEIEIKYQVLNGLLQLNLMPSIEELELAMKSTKEGREFVNKFIQPGTGDFGDTIAYAISNMGTVTAITHTLNKSLKKLGMSMDEYMSIKNLEELNKILNKKLDEIVSKPNSDKKKKDEINNILIAIDKLKKYFGHRNKLKKMKGGKDLTEGGVDPPKPEYKSPSEIRVTKMKKRVEAIKKTQEIFYNAFTKDLYTSYDNLLRVVDKLGPKLGREIPIGPHIDEVIQAFFRLTSRDLRSVHFDEALSGIRTDSKSKDIKDTFIQNLKNLIRAIDAAEKSTTSDYFKVLKAALNDVIGVIERFGKIAKVKFGGAEQEELEAEIQAEGGKYDLEYNPKFVSRDALKLDDAVGKMIYFYYIANVKDSIKNTKKELEEYGKDYDKVLTHAIRFKREEHMKTKKELLKQIDDQVAEGGLTKELAEKYKEEVEDRASTVDNLYRVVEAVELYLKNYTKKLVHDPDLVYNIKKTLESSKVIAKWFNEESGNELFKAFQAATIKPTDFKALYTAFDTALKNEKNEYLPVHPYFLFKSANTKEFKEIVGEANTTFDLDSAKLVKEHLYNSIDNFQALQNIINAFVVLGGSGMEDKEVLTPRQIYKFLVQYFKVMSVNMPFYTKHSTTAISTSASILAALNEYNITNINDIDDFKESFDYFAYVIKAMVGKVFVTLGLYQLLEAPTPLKEISPVRFILGGSDKPEIINEAVELYYRVPRLVEYYRGMITFDNSTTAPKSQISIIIDPEMKFYNLFSLMWDNIEPTVLDSGTYSDLDCNKIIKVINDIYKEYKSEKDPVKKILEEINFEINRRYGIINKDELDQFKTLKRWRKVEKGEYQFDTTPTTIDILPDDEDTSLMGVPSDNIVMDPEASAKLVDPVVRQKYELDLKYKSVLYAFREKFEASFADITGDIGDYVRNTYKNSLEQIHKEVTSARSEAERLRIVKKLITGDHKLANISQYKLLMFHETVVYGLTVLTDMLIPLNLCISNFGKIHDAILTGDPLAVTIDESEAIKILKLLITSLYAVTTDSQKLITVTFGSEKNIVQLDFSQFKDLFEQILSEVRKYIDLFRPYLPEELIDRYEYGKIRSGASEDPTPGTLRFVEEAYDELFKPSEHLDEYEDEKLATKEKEKTVYFRIQKLNNALYRLKTEKPDFKLGQALANLIFYDKTIPASGIGASTKYRTAFGNIFSKFIVNNTSGGIKPFETDATKHVLNTGVSIPITENQLNILNINNGKPHDSYRSILFLFNHFVAHFIKSFYDKPSNKIYLNLIQNFVSGKLSASVSGSIDPESNNVFPDIFVGGFVLNNAQEPKDTAILFLSNALMLRNLIYTVNNSGNQFFIEQNISSIPSYMRESYKANLPYFIKVFTELLSYTDFLKTFIDETEDIFNFERHELGTTVVASLGSSPLPGPNCLQVGATDKAEAVKYFKSLLSNLSEAIESIKESCVRVYKEVSDEEIYLQHEPEQYAKFHAKYNRYPITPASLNLYVLNEKTPDGIILPGASTGSDLHNYNYGVRSTLLDLKPVNTDLMPYNKDLVSEFNKSLNSTETVSIDGYNKFVLLTLNATRFIVNSYVYRNNYFIVEPTEINPKDDKFVKPIQDDFGLTDLYDLMTNINTSHVIDKYVDLLVKDIRTTFTKAGASAGEIRNKQRKYNFIDLNMIPFNPNALMRDIPLANIFNYNYTLEKILEKFLDVKNKPVGTLIYELIEDPFRKTVQGYTASASKFIEMFTGVGDSNFGRPKFLSDQLYNKVLLNNVYNLVAGLTPQYIENRPDTIPYADRDTSTQTIESALVHPSGFDGTYTYPYKDKDGKLVIYSVKYIKPSKLGNLDVVELDKEVANRFNTFPVRTMVFVTNLYRVIRLKLEQDLVQRHNILSSTHNLVDPQTTEFQHDSFNDESVYHNSITRDTFRK